MAQLFQLHPEVWKITVSEETGLPSSKSFPVQTAVGLSGGLNLSFCFERICWIAVVREDMVFVVVSLLKHMIVN